MAEIQLFIEGSQQGKFKGVDKDGKIICLAHSSGVIVSHQAATGQISGKRQHSPLRVTKEWSAASPQLAQALVTGEVLKSVTLKFLQPKPGTKGSTGKEVVYYTITLTDARVIEFNQSSSTSERPTEQISIAYQKIIWKWVDGDVTATDDWESSNV